MNNWTGHYEIRISLLPAHEVSPYRCSRCKGGEMTSVIAWGLAIALAIFGVHSCGNSDWYKADQAAQAAADRAAATPHVIREADGCKVYAFRANESDHFFTHCENIVTTDRNYTVTEHVGKQTVTKHKTETIVTGAAQ